MNTTSRIVKATFENVSEIQNIYNHARKQMIETGNPNQWINGYPQREIIVNDIKEETLFVCIEDDRLIGCFTFSCKEDPTYAVIYDGQWLNNEPYSVIHRLAILEHGKGIGSKCVKWCVAQDQNIRVDTHEDNTPMRKLLEKNGFQRCGIIKNTWGDNRIAYQSSPT